MQYILIEDHKANIEIRLTSSIWIPFKCSVGLLMVTRFFNSFLLRRPYFGMKNAPMRTTSTEQRLVPKRCLRLTLKIGSL